MGCGGSTPAPDPESAILEEVACSPASFALILSGHHDHPDCNGRYAYDGEENGKPRWAKHMGGAPKLFWTGRSWDCFWGGYSPEATANTPVPPLSGYDSDKGGTEIRVCYERSGGVISPAITGAFTGEQCPAGVQSGAISDAAFTASSTYGPQCAPHTARLHRQGCEGWAPDAGKKGSLAEWLQVDLGRVATVAGVQTQGNGQCPEWTTELEVHLSSDGLTFKPATGLDGGARFSGNIDQQSVVTNMFGAPASARYVRFIVKSWGRQLEPCFRVEVLLATKSGGAAAGGGTGGGDEWVGEIRTLDLKQAHGRGGFKIHPVLAVTGRTVGGKEELVPGFVDPGNNVNHSLAYHKAMYKAIKGHALPKGETLGDEHAVGWMDASTPVHGHRSVAYTGPVHMGIAQNHDGSWIYGDIINGVMWYEYWGAHKTRDFQYVRVTEVSRTVNAKRDWPWSKLVEQGQWPGEGVQEALIPKLAGELAQAAWDGNLARVRSLLDSGVPPNTEAHGGFSNGHHSALNGAARNGHAAIVSLLLEQPTKPDVESRCQSPWEVTPLQQAGFWGRAEVAPVLLRHGASLTSISGPGCGHKTAKQIAQEQRNHQWEGFVQILDTYAEGGGLSGTWFSVEKATSHPNGDRYEFRREGDRYYIIRPPGGAKNEDDYFTFDGTTTVRHVHGPTSTLLPSGDLHWDLEGGKWLSRREEGGGGRSAEASRRRRSCCSLPHRRRVASL